MLISEGDPRYQHALATERAIRRGTGTGRCGHLRLLDSKDG
jgi:hypothetical protein